MRMLIGFIVLLFVCLTVPGCGDDEVVSPAPNVVPELELSGCPPATALLGDDLIFSWQASDANGGVDGCYYGLDTREPDVWTPARACTLQGVSVGNHTFFVQAVDDEAARSVVDSCSFEVVEPVPVCELSLRQIDFGTVTLGSTAEMGFTISNSGTGALAGSVSESCDHYELVTGAGDYVLEPGSELGILARFAPTVGGEHECTIEVFGEGCGDVACVGVAFDTVACEVSPTLIDFGPVQVDSSTTRTFTITNIGGGTLSGVVDSSETYDAYQVVEGGGSYLLPPGGTRSVTVRFAPRESGEHERTLELGPNRCAGVSCTGLGTDIVRCSVSPRYIDLRGTPLGGTAERFFLIQNTGTGPMSGEVAESCGPFEVVAGGGAYTLDSYETRTVTVRFSPETVGVAECVIDTGHEVCGEVTCVGTGEGGDWCQVSPTSLDFGTVPLEVSSERTFTITNDGLTPLNGRMTESCEHYEIVSGEHYYINAGLARTVTVRFAPSAAGTHACSIDLGLAQCADVSCTGVATPAPLPAR